MKKKLIEAEPFRVMFGPLRSKRGDRSGAFLFRLNGLQFKVIISDGSDWHLAGLTGPPWEHVSVSTERRCPTWEEMTHFRNLFFEPEETVVQFHVPAEDHRNFHPFCLHLWRLVKGTFPRPPGITVAP